MIRICQVSVNISKINVTSLAFLIQFKLNSHSFLLFRLNNVSSKRYICYVCLAATIENIGKSVTCYLITHCPDCGRLEHPSDGTVNTVGGETLYNATVVYECHDGFTLIGNATRPCVSSGNWGGEEPFCEIIGK